MLLAFHKKHSGRNTASVPRTCSGRGAPAPGRTRQEHFGFLSTRWTAAPSGAAAFWNDLRSSQTAIKASRGRQGCRGRRGRRLAPALHVSGHTAGLHRPQESVPPIPAAQFILRHCSSDFRKPSPKNPSGQ